MSEVRNITKIYIHCTATNNPDQWSMASLKHLHTASRSLTIQWGEYVTLGNGWSDVGYHYSVNKLGDYEAGRPWQRIGAGVNGDNTNAIHVALHGLDKFGGNQIDGTYELLDELLDQHKLSVLDVFGHYESPSGSAQGKTCPNIEMDSFRLMFQRWRNKKNMVRIPHINLDTE